LNPSFLLGRQILGSYRAQPTTLKKKLFIIEFTVISLVEKALKGIHKVNERGRQ